MRGNPCDLLGLMTLVLGACGVREGDKPPPGPSGSSAAETPRDPSRSDDSDPATALVYRSRHVDVDARVMAEDLLDRAGIGFAPTYSGKFGHLIWVRPVDEDRARAILLANDMTRAGVVQPKAK